MTEKRGAWIEQAIANHEAALFHLCFAYLGDAALAEDAVQETFVKAYKSYDRSFTGGTKRHGLAASPSIRVRTCE